MRSTRDVDFKSKQTVLIVLFVSLRAGSRKEVKGLRARRSEVLLSKALPTRLIKQVRKIRYDVAIAVGPVHSCKCRNNDVTTHSIRIDDGPLSGGVRCRHTCKLRPRRNLTLEGVRHVTVLQPTCHHCYRQASLCDESTRSTHMSSSTLSVKVSFLEKCNSETFQ